MVKNTYHINFLLNNIGNISRRLKYIFSVVALSWTLFFFLRIVFFLIFFEEASTLNILQSFWVGIRFDLRLAVLISIPNLFFCILTLIRYWKLSYTIVLTRWIYGILLSMTVLFYVFDFANYGYTQQRIDITVFSLLENFTISLGMIWESYPVIWLIIFIIGVCYLFIIIHNRMVSITLMRPQRYNKKYQKTIQLICASLFYLFAFWGTLSQYMLLWSDAFFSRNSFVSALALNPILYFYDTTTFQEADFDIDRVRKSYPLVSSYLDVETPDINNLNYNRNINPDSNFTNDPNVVIIFMESVGLNRMGLMGNPLNPTPVLDSLSSNGAFFSKFYIPWVSTSRSVFTMLTGVPDVARRTSSRNPIIRDQYSIISQFKDYDKYYMIGGSASWANIRSLVTYNIKGMRLVEMEDFDRPRVDVWGISDLDLFREANNILRESENSKKSIFTIIQTAGNHRPYTIPNDNEGFKIESVKKGVLKSAGFKSIEQFNAIRLLDHSIGNFFKMASESSYFDNTVFVLFGDHGTADPKAEHMRADDYELKLRSYNVPLIIYAPKILGSLEKITTASGLADLMPTIAGICRIPYLNKTMGRDIFKSKNNLAFIVNKKMSPSSYGVINNKFYLRVFRDGSGMELHDILDINPGEDVKEIYIEVADSLKKIADGLYETSKYMLYHNNN